LPCLSLLALTVLSADMPINGVTVIHRKQQVRQINQKRVPILHIQKNIYIVFTLTSTLNVNNNILLALFNLSLEKKGRFSCVAMTFTLDSSVWIFGYAKMNNWLTDRFL